MIRLRRTIPLLAATSLLLVACGGGGGGGASTAASSAASTAPSTATESSAPSEAPAASTDAPASEAPSAGGGTAGGVCDLVTTDELMAAFGVPSVATTVVPGPPDTCIVKDDGDGPLVSWNDNAANGKTIYDMFVQPGQSTDVPGLGDRAAFVDNTGLMILKGDRLVVLVIAGGADLDETQTTEVSKQLGAAIAGRM